MLQSMVLQTVLIELCNSGGAHLMILTLTYLCPSHIFCPMPLPHHSLMFEAIWS